MAKLVGITELSRRLGRTERQIRRLATAGKIPRADDGRFDEDEVRNALESRTGPHRAKPLKAPEVRTPPVQSLSAARQAVTLIRDVLAEEGRPVRGPPSFDDLRSAETILKSRDRAYRLAERRGDLINKDRANALAFEWARRMRDDLLRWPSRVTPTLAAELDVAPHTLEAALDRHVRDLLISMAGIEPDEIIRALERLATKPR